MEEYKEGIRKTGFYLEYKVCRMLEQHKWRVISNRYYLDDVTNTDREIDIVAYKARRVEDIVFYTGLIISCKKSEENEWVFMTRDFDRSDPNINFYPCIIFNK